MIGSIGARTPTPADVQHNALLGLLGALADPKGTAKLLEEWKRHSELATKQIAEASAAKRELELAKRAHDEREAKLRTSEANLQRAIQDHQARHRELTDFSDKVRADRARANEEIEDARVMAKQIIADADAKASSAENTARAALAQTGNLKKEIADLERKRDGVKAELKQLAGRLSV